jgi:hypothetical protein
MPHIRTTLATLSVALAVALATTLPAQAAVKITEVAPWSSGNSPVAADWFELTNTGNAVVDITGWKIDDNSNSFASSVALTGITLIAPGESVIFLETATLAATAATFKSTWFGASAPAGLQIGAYSGAGVGLGTGGDAVNVYDVGGTLQANVVFGASPTGPYATFDNAAGLTGTISQLSVAGINGAFTAVNDTAEIGSPGRIAAVPEAPTVGLMFGGLVALGVARRRRGTRA